MHKFTKKERLTNKTQINNLFNNGQSIKIQPLQLLWKFNDFESAPICQVLIVVPKKKIRLASHRNLIKRRVKEQAKSIKLAEFIAKGVSFFLIYTSKQILNSNEIKRRIEVLSQKL